MSEIDIDELKRLEAVATPGPWEHGTYLDGSHHVTADDGSDEGRTIINGFAGLSEADAAYIAAARNALPALTLRCERAEREDFRGLYRQKLDREKGLLEQMQELAAERDAARKTIRRLKRRCQRAEKAANEKIGQAEIDRLHRIKSDMETAELKLLAEIDALTARVAELEGAMRVARKQDATAMRAWINHRGFSAESTDDLYEQAMRVLEVALRRPLRQAALAGKDAE